MSIHPEDINVLDLLPQRPPFIMIDKLIHCDHTSSKAIFEVREDGLFCNNGSMEETGLIENIAQTCAAGASFKQLLENNGFNISGEINNTFSEQKSNTSSVGAKIGVIVMINSLEIKRRPLVGEVLETTMTIEAEFSPATLVRSEVRIGDEIVAICRMKLLLTDKTPG